VPPTWAAVAADAATGKPGRPGVNLVGSLTRERAERIAARVRLDARPGDVVLVSIHWGSNWGYEVPEEQIAFAHALIDAGVDVVHGHSSHHPRPIEVYRGRLVLYGCGDLVNDYEGITGHEEFRSDLRLLYLASVDPADGAFLGLRMIPVRSRRLRLERASADQAGWLAARLSWASRPFGCGVGLGPAGDLHLERGIASPT
jgi:poly-gamma-glutamate capsule biosynthesis protein CapA/YwtB (metallophosphatase superfamily)